MKTAAEKLTTAYVDKNVSRIPFSGCWIWTAYVNKAGYGSIGSKGGNQLVHRAMYEKHIGRVSRRNYVCHTCDVPSCINPDHLFAGTPSDNAKDRANKGRSAPKLGHLNGRSKLSNSSVLRIRSLYRSGVKQIDLANMFGMAEASISQIIRGKTWKFLP